MSIGSGPFIKQEFDTGFSNFDEGGTQKESDKNPREALNQDTIQVTDNKFRAIQDSLGIRTTLAQPEPTDNQQLPQQFAQNGVSLAHTSSCSLSSDVNVAHMSDLLLMHPPLLNSPSQETSQAPVSSNLQEGQIYRIYNPRI